jgi:hypothetical protein
MSKSVSKWLSVIALIALSAFCLGVFLYQFNGQLSENQQDWGAFGSYMSGTIGVFAACLAVAWLIRSVSLQQVELQHLKAELKSSSNEQIKQTHISALTALLTSNQQAVANDRTLLSAMNNGSEGESIKQEHGETTLMIHTLSIEGRIEYVSKEIDFYEKQLESYLPEVYQPTENNSE